MKTLSHTYLYSFIFDFMQHESIKNESTDVEEKSEESTDATSAEE